MYNRSAGWRYEKCYYMVRFWMQYELCVGGVGALIIRNKECVGGWGWGDMYTMEMHCFQVYTIYLV